MKKSLGVLLLATPALAGIFLTARLGPIQVVSTDPLNTSCGLSKVIQVVASEVAGEGHFRCCNSTTQLWEACDVGGQLIDGKIFNVGSGFLSSSVCLIEVDQTGSWPYQTVGDSECFLFQDTGQSWSLNSPYPGSPNNSWSPPLLQCVGGTQAGRRCLHDATCGGGTCTSQVVAPHLYKVRTGSVSPYGDVVHRSRGGPGEKPIVVINFHDGAQSNLITAGPLLESKDLPATYCISSGRFGDLTGYTTTNCAPGVNCPEARVTEAEARQMILRGWEIQSHGHAELSALQEEYWNTTGNWMLKDWSDNADWMLKNAGHTPDVYCVPGGAWDFEWSIQASSFFDAIQSTTLGYQAPSGMMGTADGSYRFIGSAFFPEQTSHTAANICAFIEDAVIPDPSAMFVLGFHSIKAAGQPIASNEYPLDEFTKLVECLAWYRDSGQIDVMTYGQAVKERKAHLGRWNKIVNPRFGDVAASTTAAAYWASSASLVTFEANEDAWPGRQARVTEPSGDQSPLSQRVNGLIPGKRYVFAVDLEWDNVGTSTADREVQLRITSWSGGGTAHGYNQPGHIISIRFDGTRCELAGPDAGQLCNANSMCDDDAACSGGGAGVCACNVAVTAGTRGVAWLEFTAPGPYVDAVILKRGDTAQDQVMIVRYPRLFPVDSIGGNDTYAASLDFNALNWFEVEIQLNGGTAVPASSPTTDDFNLLEYYATCTVGGGCGARTVYGPGPSKFIITRVELDSDNGASAISNADFSITGNKNGTGTIFWSVTGHDFGTGDYDTLGGPAFSLLVQDNESIADYWSSQEGPSASDSGNQLHFKFVNNDTDAQVVTLRVEGFAVN